MALAKICVLREQYHTFSVRVWQMQVCTLGIHTAQFSYNSTTRILYYTKNGLQTVQPARAKTHIIIKQCLVYLCAFMYYVCVYGMQVFIMGHVLCSPRQQHVVLKGAECKRTVFWHFVRKFISIGCRKLLLLYKYKRVRYTGTRKMSLTKEEQGNTKKKL